MNSYVLITGAAGGLGKALAAECAARGWSLFLTDLSDADLAALAQGIERLYGVSVRYSACDLTEQAAREALWAQIGAAGLRFHMLLNVAGIDYEGPFAQRGLAELQTILRLNIEASVLMVRRVLEHRDPSRELHILNVSSLAGYSPMPIKAVYAASKRFLLDLSLALRQELRDAGVTVTALCPAGMPTNASCIRGIMAQGLMGQLTTVGVGAVAAQAIDAALAGRAVCIPGALNQALRLCGALIPAPLLAALIGARWRRAHQLPPDERYLPQPPELSIAGEVQR